MKLEMSLPERPGLLHAVPILNIFALLQLFFLLGPAMVLRSGVAVDLAPSKFQMERYQDSLVVTLGPGESQPRIHLGRDSLSMVELAARLDQLRLAGAAGKSIVLLQTDDSVLPIELARFIYEYAWKLPTITEITELFGEYHFEPSERNLRLASGLAYQDLKLALQQSSESSEPEIYLETYRNARLSLMGVKYDPPPVFKEIAGLDELVAAIDKLKFRFSQRAIDIVLTAPSDATRS